MRCFKKEKSALLSTLEERQIIALGKSYGINLIIVAVKHAKTADIREIAKLLAQLGGFRHNLDPVLTNIILEREQAKQYYGSELLRISDSLCTAVRPINDQYIANLLVDNKNTVYDLWKTQNGCKNISLEEQYAINGAIKKFGINLTRARNSFIQYTKPSIPH